MTVRRGASASLTTPPFAALRELARRLDDAGVVYALGGSGLLAFHGLVDSVRDWDVTTDAPRDAVVGALTNLTYEEIGPNGIFATAYMFKVRLGGASIDLMGSFALRSGAQIMPVETRVTGYWHGIPLGCPRAWSEAYQLLGRVEKVSLLRKFLAARAALSS